MLRGNLDAAMQFVDEWMGFKLLLRTAELGKYLNCAQRLGTQTSNMFLNALL